MRRVVEVLAGLGGVASTTALAESGISPRMTQRAASAGLITRVCHGWYAVEGADPRVVAAIRAGGSLGCVSGTSFHGLWEPPGVGVHLSVPPGARTPELGGHEGMPTHDVVHWGYPASREDAQGVLPLLACLAQVLACAPADYAFAILESALRRRRIDETQRAALLTGASRAVGFLVRAAGSLADSGTESLFRFRLLAIAMRSQVGIPGVGVVDFVIGDRLIIEIDSERHHGEPGQRRRDLGRDAVAVGLGFIVLRFDYWQVLYDWETVESTVLAVITRGEHLRGRWSVL